jgi:hippurate hydrolase
MPDTIAETMTHWRRHLHAHPELSLREAQTAAFVSARLAEMGVTHEGGVGGHGVVATISRGGSNRSVGLRADMDALPITETGVHDYVSQNAGVMHACGHDGHTASLLGAARLLLEDDSWRGTVRLVFQPAEEGFGGAAAMLADGLLARFPMEQIFGYHNWPGLEAGTVMLHDGPIMAAADNFTIRLRGQAGHAAMPHLTSDPVQALALIITALNAVVARNVDPLDSAVISTCVLSAGQAYNQIPTEAMLGGTFRALSPAMMDFLRRRIAAVAENTAAMFDLTAEMVFKGYLPPTSNTVSARDLAVQAAQDSGLPLRRDMAPCMGAEDFGRFLEVIPGAYAWIGNGPSAGLHHPAFDYNDDILPVAAQFLAASAKAALA